MTGPTEQARELIAMAKSRGFAAAGVCSVRPSGYAQQMHDWLAAGRHGEMGYLADDLATRLDPAAILRPPHGPTDAPARSVMMVLDLYATRNDPPENPEPGFGRIARYARGRDYHRAMKKRMHAIADELRLKYPGHEFRTFVDTAPVIERELAARCGLGWVGKHTLVIHPRLGSWSLLGGFVTTMDLAPPPEQWATQDHCGSCTRCIDACPTRCIEPYSVDASRCVSYLTIEMRGAYPADLAKQSGDWLLGCDVCQEVCPHNSPRNDSVEPAHEGYEQRRRGFDLLEVLGWDEPARREAFTTSPMKRVKLEQLKRNALVVAGNHLSEHDLPELRARVEAIASDDSEPEIVRAAARDALRRVSE